MGPAGGKGGGSVGDHISAVRRERQRIGGEHRVDPGREGELGRVRLDQADVLPAARLRPPLGLGKHHVGQVDADDPALRPDHLLHEREVQAGAAADLDHGVT